jgi:uncharacterized protein (DUF2267 family)
MTASKIAAFDTTVQITNAWLNEIMDRLVMNDPQKAYHALRAVLHALRDRLPATHAAAMGAQLPLLVRGIFYEGWHPNRAPVKDRKKVDFLAHVATGFPGVSNAEVEELTRAVLSVLARHISKGEIESVKLTLPSEIRDLWSEPNHTLWF